ncbi:MAG: radical SAM protein, partial [Clostridia bacterium]
LFLMTTADFSIERFLNFAKKVKSYIPSKVNLVANIGDFDDDTAKKLKDIGFYGFYHICRLREGIDTDIPLQRRLDTINSGLKHGLELIYCIEPIGVEHTYSEIADEMIRAREFGVKIMAVMGRTSVPHTHFENSTEIDDLELSKICAVTRLVTNPSRSMNVHEPKFTPLLAGINQLYAEIGINPRDTKLETEKNRGFSIENVKNMLKSAGYFA